MFFDVQIMYSHGFPLAREEVEAGPFYTGYLLVQHWPEQGGPDQFLSQARLLDSSDMRKGKNILLPLMNPMFLQTSQGRMLIHGSQIVDEGGRARHVSQCWLARPVLPEQQSDEQQELW
jgi:hypothetical protein